MPTSPASGKTDLIAFDVLVNGSAISGAYDVSRVEVRKHANRIPSATVEVFDGDPQQQTFPISESDDFVPGTPVTIKAGYHSTTEVVFEGVVVSHALRVRNDGRAHLVVSCRDAAVTLTTARKGAYYVKQTDSDAITSVVQDAGLTADVDATPVTHGELVQHYASDWDFVVARAEANGRLVLVDDGTVAVKAPVVSGSADLVVGYGDALQRLDAEIDARTQMPSVTCVGWDLSAQQTARADATEPSVNAQGNLAGSDLATKLGTDAVTLRSTAPLTRDDLQAWADAHLLRARLARIQGSVSFQGNATPKPGSLLELAGLGARFNGTAFVSGVEHVIESGTWTTTAHFGLSPRGFVESHPDVTAPPASGLLPGAQGLHVGTVKAITDDPDTEMRVQVDVPTLSSASDGVWARLATFYATDAAGAFFLPEVGDEVALGFFNDDPRHPVILGSLYSSARSAAYTPDDTNSTKAITSNSQIQIVFDDEKKVLTLETPGGHSVTLDDDQTTVTVADSNGNSVEMASGGVTVSSASDLTLKATGSVTIQGASVSVQGDTDVSVQGLNVSVSADASLTASGTASAELSASGNTSVKGALVMIN